MKQINEMCSYMDTVINNQNQIMDKLKIERWKQIGEYPHYNVSSFGRVWSNRAGRYLKPCVDNHGYHYVRLYLSRKAKNYSVHKLIATAFVPNPENKKCVDEMGHLSRKQSKQIHE